MPDYTDVLRLELADFGQRGWQEVINANMVLIDQAVAQSIFLVSLRGVWANDEAYSVDDLALDEVTAEIYKCLVAHTSASAPDTFGDDRVANPTYWEFIDTAATSAAAAAIYASNASTHADNAQISADNAATQASDALTHATNSYNFAVAASDSAAAAAISAATAAIFGTNMRPWGSFLAAAELTVNYTLAVAEAILVSIKVHTVTAFTGATVTIRIGTTVGGDDLVQDTDIKALGAHALALEDAAIVSFTPFAGGNLHITITQTTPTAVGQAVVIVDAIPIAA